MFDGVPLATLLDALCVGGTHAALLLWSHHFGDGLLEQPWPVDLDGFPVGVFDDVVLVVFAVLKGVAFETVTGVLVGQH